MKNNVETSSGDMWLWRSKSKNAEDRWRPRQLRACWRLEIRRHIVTSIYLWHRDTSLISTHQAAAAGTHYNC